MVPELTGFATKPQKQAWKRSVRRAYFAELGKWVELYTDHELKVLDGGTCSSFCQEVRFVDHFTPVRQS